MAKKTKSAAQVADESILSEQSPVEKAADILKRELPRLINDVTMMVKRPFRFIWDESSETASTDCFAEIRVAPRPFIEGEREVGYGTVYHETGHICHSPYGVQLMKEANHIGGQFLQSLMNIILDRKDDAHTVQDAPGFAEILRRRLKVIRTIARRKHYAELLKKYTSDLDEQSNLLRNFKPVDAYEDFFMAAKCGKSPRFKATKKAMKYVRLKVLAEASPEKLLWIAQKVSEILAQSIKDEAKNKANKNGKSSKRGKKGNSSGSGDGENNESEEDDTSSPGSVSQKQKKAETRLMQMFADGEKATGGKASSEVKAAIENAMKQYLSGLRHSGTKEVLKRLATMGMVHPGPISVGLAESVPVQEVKPDPRFAAEYQAIRSEIDGLIAPMIKTLRNISTPSEFDLYGQDEGELDFNEVARIATGLSGFRMETVVERDIDADIHFAIDCSGSMGGDKIKEAKKLGVIFSEAIEAMKPSCVGRLWSFNDSVICDYGETSTTSGFVTLEGRGGNSDTHMLEVVGMKLLKSQKRRKILFVLCDDGPDSIEMVQRLTRQLTARGVIVIHLLVGVHGTPDIYPIELLYSSIEECLEEFGTLLQTIISHLK